MRIVCPWCFKEIEVDDDFFKGIDGQFLEYVLYDCPHCGRTMIVEYPGETARVYTICGNTVETDWGYIEF